MGFAGRIFGSKPDKPSTREERQTRELARMKGVIAEITAVNRDLKKTLSGLRITSRCPPNSNNSCTRRPTWWWPTT